MTKALRVIATGAHSGLGYEAIKSLLASSLASSGCELTLLARDANDSRVQVAKQQLVKQVSKLAPPWSSTSIQTMSMDLANLATVRAAANDVARQHLCTSKTSGTDIFLLNAAVAKATKQMVVDQDRADHTLDYPADSMTDDATSSIETTACVNHVAHLLFIKLMFPAIVQNAVNGRKTRIVFTGSALHRSLKQSDTLDEFFGSQSSSPTPWTLRESYAASKFLQLLGVRALRRKMEAYLRQHDVLIPTGSIEICIVQPGFVPQTGLSRETGFASRLLMTYLLPWAPFATSLEDGGEYIAKACYIDFDRDVLQTEEAPDRFGQFETMIRGALLEVKNRRQQFGTPDKRSEDHILQEKWWPAVCGEL